MDTPEQKQKTEHPSMTEILSSIRHVISNSEDQKANTSSFISSQSSFSEISSSPEDVLELTDSVDEFQFLDTETKENSAPLNAHAAFSSSDALLSNTSEDIAASAFSTLSRAVEIKQATDETQGIAGKTVDELVKEIMRPFIKDWLNQHLPLIVERLVTKEIERLTVRAHTPSASPKTSSPSPSKIV